MENTFRLGRKTIQRIFSRLKRRRRKSRRSLFLEPLEIRRMLATVAWAVDADGFWDVASNWSTGNVPQPGDDVVIDRAAGSFTVTHRSGTSDVNSLVSTETLTLSGGSLDVAGTVQVSNTFSLAGGTLMNATVLPGLGGEGVSVTSDSTLDGVTLDADVALTSYTCCAHSYLRIENGLTLNSQLTMTQSDSFDFSTILEVAGNQTISGSGTIQFAQQGSRRNTSVSNYIYSKSPGETLTIGSGITIQGKGGFVGRSNAALINLGTINADTASNTIVVQGSSVTNDGTLTATAATLDVNNLTNNVGTALATGGTLDLDGTYTIDQSLPVTDATLALRGDLNNTGSIDATNSRLRLHGNFTVAKLGTFNRIGPDNRADIIGTLTNAAATLTLDADTDWTLEGGRINGGTVAGDGTLRVTSDSTLDGVTLDADVALTSYTCCAHSYLRIENGLTLNSQLTMTQSDSFDFSTILEVAGNQTISGSGTIQFAQQGSRRKH